MKPKVLLDLDGVVAAFYESFAAFLNTNYGTRLPLDHEPDCYKYDDWGFGTDLIDVKQASNEWVDQGGYVKTLPYQNVRAFSDKLHNKCQVFIVTARIDDISSVPESTKSKIKSDTETWLKEQGIPTDNLHFAYNKVEFCKEHGIDIMIEDKLTTAIKGAKNGLRTILVDRAWNRSPPRLNVYRAQDYEGVLKLIDRLKQE
jgi:uncharacterized HAD superfamily protein